MARSPPSPSGIMNNPSSLAAAPMAPVLREDYARWIPFCREATLECSERYIDLKLEELRALLGGSAFPESLFRERWGEPFLSYVRRGAKLLRPYLVCTILDAYAIDPRSLPVAVALAEIVQASSLMLDDIADDSLLRRGGPTAQYVHGVLVAGGSASAWLNSSLQLAWELREPCGDEIAFRLADALAWEHFVTGLGVTIDVTWGWEQTLDHTPEEYLQEVLHRSTSYTFRLPLKIGCIVAGAPEHELRALSTFGEKIGTAFQLVDDVLNVRPGDDSWGKEIGEDVAQGKITLQVLRALDRASAGERDELVRTLGAKTHDPRALARAIEILESTGALRSCADDAARLTAEAKELLHELASPVLRERLSAFADYVVCRSL